MSQRFTIQDATGIIIDGEGDMGVLLGYADSVVGVPANGSLGYQKGCRIIDTVTGAEFVNTGTLASAAFVAQGLTTLGVFQLPLTNFRAIASNDIPALAGTPASGILASDTAPKLKRANTSTDKALKIEWAASGVIEITGDNIVIPPDMDVTKASSINLLVKMGGATDTPTFAVNVFPALGGADAGGNTGAASAAMSTLTKALAANVFAAFPTFASVSITPGAHTTDVAQLYGVYLRYTKKILTS